MIKTEAMIRSSSEPPVLPLLNSTALLPPPPRADLYATGILTRVLLTGTDANDAMLSRHLSRKIRAIIERCTQLDPRKRYPSAQALQRDIRKLMHKEMKGISCS